VKKEEKGSIKHLIKEPLKGLSQGRNLLYSRNMYNTIKGEKKLEGASNYRSWKKRIDLILKKNKVLYLVKGKVKKPTNDSSDVEKVKFRELELVAMTLMVERIKENLVPFIVNINCSQEMYEALSMLFTIKTIGQVAILKNELRTTNMNK